MAKKSRKRASPKRRRSNPSGLSKIQGTPSFPIDEYIEEGLVGAYRTDSGIEIFVWGVDVGDRIEAPFNAIVYAPRTGETLRIEDGPDEYLDFDTDVRALGMAMRIAAEVDEAKWSPSGRGFEENFASFMRASTRNRVEFYRFLQWNDPNGSYLSVLTMEPEEVRELFEQVFEDYDLSSAPWLETYSAIKKRLLRESAGSRPLLDRPSNQP
jgi:hypothetical protein